MAKHTFEVQFAVPDSWPMCSHFVVGSWALNYHINQGFPEACRTKNAAPPTSSPIFMGSEVMSQQRNLLLTVTKQIKAIIMG